MSSSSSATLTFGRILDALGGLVIEQSGARATEIAAASCDSRQINPGDCFVAVCGYREDGIRYWASARAAGAAALVCETALEGDPGVPFARVSDGYAAMGRIAELVYGRPAEDLQLVGITGTNGKTTCAYLFDRILEAAGRCTGMVGTVAYKCAGQTLEADRTTPMPFALQELLRSMCRDGVETVTLEMSSHSLAQRRLGTATFSAALFTNLTGDHLDYHRSMEEYYQAKRRLFVEDLQDGAVALINVDDPYGGKLHEELAARGRVNAYSFSMAGRAADFNMEDLQTAVDGGSGTLVCAGGEQDPLWIHTPMIGRYNLCNAGCVAALALAMRVPPTVIADTIGDFRGAPGRLEPIRRSGCPSVFVDYAHTDDALENVLQALAAVKTGALSVVFGCGGDRDASKRPRMARVAQKYADRIYVTSDNPRTEDPEEILEQICTGFNAQADVTKIRARRQAIRIALAEADPADIVLIAGKGHETYQEINGIKHPFDDACVVRAALKELP